MQVAAAEGPLLRTTAIVLWFVPVVAVVAETGMGIRDQPRFQEEIQAVRRVEPQELGERPPQALRVVAASQVTGMYHHVTILRERGKVLPMEEQEEQQEVAVQVVDMEDSAVARVGNGVARVPPEQEVGIQVAQAAWQAILPVLEVHTTTAQTKTSP